MLMQFCSMCGETKPLTVEVFGKLKRCRACIHSYRKARRNRNGREAYKKELAAARISRRGRWASDAEWRADKLKANRAWRVANMAWHRAWTKQWNAANPEKMRHFTVVRRAQLAGAMPDNADLEAIKRIYLRAQRRTKATGIPHEVDHIIPISRGGLHHQDNLQVLTMFDNRSKGATL